MAKFCMQHHSQASRPEPSRASPPEGQRLPTLRAYSRHTHGILTAYTILVTLLMRRAKKRHQRDIKMTSWRKCATPPLRGVRRGGVAGVHISKKPRLFTNVNDRGGGWGRGLLMWCLTNVKTYWIFTFVCTTGDNGAPAPIPQQRANT